MNPHTILQERYPTADFSIYFRTGEACQTVKGLNTHLHHWCPKAQFPEYADLDKFPDNGVWLAVEDHAFVHKLLSAAVPELSNVAGWIEANTWTPERRSQYSTTMKAVHAIPENKARHSAATKIAVNRSEVKALVSAAAVKMWSNDSHRQKMRALQLVIQGTPEARERASASLKCRWNDHEARAQNSAAIKIAKNTPEGRAQNALAGELGGCATGFVNSHERWHIKRGIVSLTCSLCVAEPLLPWSSIVVQRFSK